MKARAEFTGDPFAKVSNSSNYSPLLAKNDQKRKSKNSREIIENLKRLFIGKRERVLFVN